MGMPGLRHKQLWEEIMHSAHVVRFVVVAVLLTLVLAACGGGAAPAASSNSSPSNQSSTKSEAHAAPSGSLSAQGVDACQLITAEDVKRISGYDGATFDGQEGACLINAGDRKLGINVVLGMDPGVDIPGMEQVDLGNGIKGTTTSSGWLVNIIFPDSSTVNLIISGYALHGDDTSTALFTKGDGTDVDLPSQYQAYAQAVLANVGKAK
jgi:hypothetical protein